MPKSTKPKKVRKHLSMPQPLWKAMEALARLQEISLSDLVEDVARDHLKEKNALPEITAEQIADEMQKMQQGSKAAGKLKK